MSNNPFIDSQWRNMSGACAFQAVEVAKLQLAVDQLCFVVLPFAA
jgi:hypothetical protein